MYAALDIEKIAKEIISHHGFSSNTVEGFSCYIPDRYPFQETEGLLLWSFSKTYKRIETQIQKFTSKARIHRMEEMLGLSAESYEHEFIEAISQYLYMLRRGGHFAPIGSGVKLFGKVKEFNLAVDLDVLQKSHNIIREFEVITITNPIVKFCEKSNYFMCKHKNLLISEKYL